MINKGVRLLLSSSIALFCATTFINTDNFFMNNIAFAENENNKDFDNVLKNLRNKIAPDDRIALFDIKAKKENDSIVLSGKLLNSTDKELVLKEFSNLGKIVDKIEIFPFKETNDTPYAIINSPVMNIRANGKHSAELVSQSIMGSGMKIITRVKGQDDWVYVSMEEDKYLGWVRKPDITFVNKKDFDEWFSHDKVLITEPVVNLLKSANKNDKTDFKLYLTTRVNFISENGDFYKIRLPKGNKHYSDKEFFIPKTSARLIGKNLTPLRNPQKELILKSKSMISAPYLWGGASPAMMDCSGFTQMLYKYAGYSIPRDADQQQSFSTPIKNRADLKVGDLVFFSENKNHATHVGMYIGDNRFIHSSVGYNGVAITSFDPKDSLYNPVYIKIYFGAGRIIK
ncbi:MAG: C40 family peptidase [Candidatus Sericytochromatia bacterium]